MLELLIICMGLLDRVEENNYSDLEDEDSENKEKKEIPFWDKW